MAKDNAGSGAANKDNVVALSTSCHVAKCTKKVDRLGFCAEHYVWFKEGLVTKKGQRPQDFDKKYQAFVTRKSAA